jgi:hypothetical protein
MSIFDIDLSNFCCTSTSTTGKFFQVGLGGLCGEKEKIRLI